MTYEELIGDLGTLLGLTLTPDRNNTCQLLLEDELVVFLEPTAEADDLIVGIPLGSVAPGKGAERLFQAALIANGKLRPFLGSFAYSRATDQLILFERAPLKYIDATMTLALMRPLIDEARRWRDGIRGGTIPVTP
jgi:hypothetical protein